MSFQPTLLHTLLSTDSISYYVYYGADCIVPDDPEMDELHIHSCYELYMNITGSVSFLVDGKVYAIHPGDIVLTRPGDAHYCICSAPCVHEHFCLWFLFPRTSSFETIFRARMPFGLIRSGDDTKQAIKAHLQELHHADSDTLSELYAFFAICELLRREHMPTPQPESSIPSVLRDILAYMDENFTHITCIKDIVAIFPVSTSTLNRLFGTYIHTSPLSYIKDKKLSLSEKLLREGKSVTDACYMSGFSDCSRFIRFFTKKYGKTPLQYKKNLSSQSDGNQ